MSTDNHHLHEAQTSSPCQIARLRTEAPIIIIGNGGSGSSLLDRILNAHPDISMQGEMKFLIARAWIAFWAADANTALRNIKQHFLADPGLETRIMESPARHQEFLRKLEEDEFQRTGAILCEAVAKWFCLDDQSTRYWGFKEIANGAEARYDWKIYDHVFPQAYWVHVIRHPLTYMYAAARLNNQSLSVTTVPHLLKDWLAVVKKSQERVATGRYFEIKYEDLIKAPKLTLSPLLDQIGVGWHEECRTPLARQWGAASERYPLPSEILKQLFKADDRWGAVFKRLPLSMKMRQRIFKLDELREIINELGYQQEPAESDLPLEPKFSPAHLEAANAGRQKLSGAILREEDQCWVFDLSHTAITNELAAVADDVEYWRRSPLRLFENDKLLGPAHALHLRIRASGNGSYSHWQNRLLFSTSDNTNPNTNGRVYSFDLKG